nr:hypothetical protein [Gemmatimonadota bacterium]NIU76574.1 hypothetical protein [Gammaproteobacteria bacterium]
MSVLIVGALAAPWPSSAQDRVPADSVLTDTTVLQGAARLLEAQAATREPPYSPMGAFWRSLVLPGWAQFGLGSESRGAFYGLMEATSLFMWFRTQTRLAHARRTGPEDSPLVESRTQQREDWIALAVFWAFFSAADGWVSVQLYGFDEA